MLQHQRYYMNELYTQTETIRGRQYRYKSMTRLETWSPLIVLLVLAVYIEYWH